MYLNKKWENMNFSCIHGHQDSYQQHYVINRVKTTFFAYTYDIPRASVIHDWILPMPNLYHLAAMKIHAIGQRNKWKDYVDIAFIIKKYGIVPVAEYAKEFFH